MSASIAGLKRGIGGAKSTKADGELGQEAELRIENSNLVILAFGNFNSGKSDVLERIRLGGQANSQESPESNVASDGIRELRISFDGVVFRIIDSGDASSGQELVPSRATDVTAIMFIVNIADYDQSLPSDASRTRIEADLELFDTISNSPQFKAKPIILFANNSDHFRRKLGSVPLRNFFPDYEPGFDGDAIGYLITKFADLNRGEKKEIYTHVTSMDDRNDSQFVQAAVKDIKAQKSTGVPEV